MQPIHPSRRSLRAVAAAALPMLGALVFLLSLTQEEGAAGGLGKGAIRQSDLDGDGTPDVTAIDTDRTPGVQVVMVYDQEDDMVWAGTWQAGTDFDDDAWVFQDAGGHAKLVILFSHDGGSYDAKLYDDADKDGQVSYRWGKDGTVSVREAAFPTVEMTADAPWVRADGSVNYLVQVTLYRAQYAGGVELPFPRDGRPASQIEVRDQDGDGVPNYELVRYFPDVPAHWGVPRTYINANVDDIPPPGFDEGVFWPYLGAVESDGWQPSMALRPGGDRRPPVQVDFEGGRILAVADFLPRWGTGMRLFFNSTTPLAKGQANVLAFERFGHYRFSGGALPDMIIRRTMDSPTSNFAVRRGDDVLVPNQVSISWRQTVLDSLVWEYKVELAGMHEVPSATINFADFAIHDIAYAEWPAWCAEQDWAYAAFVATEGLLYTSNEGIYEWYSLGGVVPDVSLSPSVPDRIVPGSQAAQEGYLLGLTDESPGRYYQSIRAGMRGEYADLLESAPRVYLSAIDHKLHLVKASHGVWNVDGRAEMRYANLDGDAYLDQWQYTEDGAEESGQLNLAGNHLLCSDRGQVIIEDFTASPALYEAQPPRTGAEWRAFGELLERYRTDLPAGDLAGMVGQFEADMTEIRGATLQDVRLTKTGFRFVLSLEPGFSVAADAQGLGVGDLAPGSYLVTYEGDFRIEPLTAPRLSVAQEDIGFDPRPTEADWTTVRAVVHNSGLQDVTSLPLRLLAARDGAKPQLLAEEDAFVPGGAEFTLSARWWPPTAGEWTVWVEADPAAARPDGIELDSLALQCVRVLPAEAPRMLRVLGSQDGVQLSWPALLLLGAVPLAAGCLLWIVLRSGCSSAARVQHEGGDRGSTSV